MSKKSRATPTKSDAGGVRLALPFVKQTATNKMDHKLKPLREQIDEVDTQILDLLNRRARFAQEVGHVKAETNAPVFRPEREAQVLRSVAERNPGPLNSHDIQT